MASSLQAELYRVPVEKLTEHANLRAEAMTIRDTKAEQSGVTELTGRKLSISCIDRGGR